MKLSVSVIIPNYNGRKLLEQNLPSVITALQRFNDYEVIVSDDASSDGSVSFLRENYPAIKIITSVRNTGFSAACNRAIREAKKDLTLILNNDVKLKDDYFLHQLKYFEKPDTFGVMGSICSGDERLIDAAKYPRWSGFKVSSTLNFALLDASLDLIPTYFLSGANALVETKKLLELNGFDEIFGPFYMEDVDLSVRAWRMNWKCYYEPKAVCFHSVSETIGKHNPKGKVKLIAKRNKFIFHGIHLNGREKFFWRIEVALNLLFRWLRLDFSYYKSYFAFRGRSLEMALSREAFAQLGPLKSLMQIIDEIQGSVEGLPKRFF